MRSVSTSIWCTALCAIPYLGVIYLWLNDSCDISIIMIVVECHDNDSMQSYYHDRLYLSITLSKMEASMIVLRLRKLQMSS